MIGRLLIANRGEIAVRVIRTCRLLGIETVAVCSSADRDALHVQLADRSLCIGPPSAPVSYLNANALVTAALGMHCDAVHPGYGFLSENAAFARTVEQNGMIFVGPRPEQIAAMGDKIAARGVARSLGVPTIPGSEGRLERADARRVASETGYPLLLKAAAGGGGRGMRIVRAPEELEIAFDTAGAEALAAFGDGTLYAERLLEGVRHVEIQVLSDGERQHVHLGERDCTLQRRSQKLLEEAPAPISVRCREAMQDAAIALTSHLRYRGAGTIEFVYDPERDASYFLEMNTRIQVEHPVTEMITGVDLIAEQLRVASGEGISFEQEAIRASGHAIECRINAEDPDEGFRPSPGRITSWSLPAGEGVRVDTHAFEGYTIPPFYDSLLAKLVVAAPTRERAIVKMREALSAFEIGGVRTTRDFHLRVLADRRFAENRTDTKWVEREFLAPTAGAAS